MADDDDSDCQMTIPELLEARDFGGGERSI